MRGIGHGLLGAAGGGALGSGVGAIRKTMQLAPQISSLVKGADATEKEAVSKEWLSKQFDRATALRKTRAIDATRNVLAGGLPGAVGGAMLAGGLGKNPLMGAAAGGLGGTYLMHQAGKILTGTPEEHVERLEQAHGAKHADLRKSAAEVVGRTALVERFGPPPVSALDAVLLEKSASADKELLGVAAMLSTGGILELYEGLGGSYSPKVRE